MLAMLNNKKQFPNTSKLHSKESLIQMLWIKTFNSIFIFNSRLTSGPPFPIWKVMLSKEHFANWFRNTPIIIMTMFVECPRLQSHANELTLEDKSRELARRWVRRQNTTMELIRVLIAPNHVSGRNLKKKVRSVFAKCVLAQLKGGQGKSFFMSLVKMRFICWNQRVNDNK